MMGAMRSLISSKSLEEGATVNMRRLPLFGKRVADEQIDFQYPSEEEFQKLQTSKKEIRLTSITTQHWVLHGIQLHFSGDIKTPLFLDEG